MFTKEDFREYLTQIGDMEESMLKLYGSILRDLEDEKLRHTFERLTNDERRHVETLKQLERI